jgi:hypothetical protein
MHLNLARQMVGQGFPVRLLDQRLHTSRLCHGLNRFFLMQRVELLLQLLNLKGDLLRRLPKLRPLQLGNMGFKLGDLQALRLERAQQLAHQRLQGVRVCRQMIWINLHGKNIPTSRIDPPWFIQSLSQRVANRWIITLPTLAFASGSERASQCLPEDSPTGLPIK